MPELYIYYHAPATDAARVADCVRGWQRALRHRLPSLQARLLRRAGDTTDTWMETYAAADGELDPGRQAELAAGPPDLSAERHVEVFEPCAS